MGAVPLPAPKSMSSAEARGGTHSRISLSLIPMNGGEIGMRTILGRDNVNFDRRLMEGGDKLVLRGLKFHGYHGVKPEERTLGQKFLVDVDAWLDLHQAGVSDRLSDTVSYTDIYRIVKQVVEGEPQNLLESVAHRIAVATFTKFPQISDVRVKVGKPHVAVPGQLDYLGVEILRTSKAEKVSTK